MEYSVDKKKELNIIMKAKDLCSYIMQVTKKSPKEYRYTFTSRLQNMSIDIVKDIYLANDIYVASIEDISAKERFTKRLDLQREAMANLRLLGYIAQLALEQRAITTKQYEMIAKQTTDIIYMLAAWRKQDLARFHNK